MKTDKLKEIMNKLSSHPEQFKKISESISIVSKNKERISMMTTAALDQYIAIKEEYGERFMLSTFFEAIISLGFADGYRVAQSDSQVGKKDKSNLN